MGARRRAAPPSELAPLRAGDLDREQLAALALVDDAVARLLADEDRVRLDVREEPAGAEDVRRVDDAGRLPVALRRVGVERLLVRPCDGGQLARRQGVAPDPRGGAVRVAGGVVVLRTR